MKVSIRIKSIQHINNFDLELDGTEAGLKCVVGKNGVGKTTIIKCIRNFSLSNTFSETSQTNIFNKQSEITYCIDNENYKFTFDESINSLNSNNVIPLALRNDIDVELPIPFGNRFIFFQSIHLFLH